MSRQRAQRGRRGLTLLELVLAVGLFAILSLAVFELLEGTLVTWRKSEVRRNQMGTSTAVLELIARDFQSLEGGSRGDLVVEWETFDTNSDGGRETVWPRIRLVRQASASDAARAANLLGRAGSLGPTAAGKDNPWSARVAYDVGRKLAARPNRAFQHIERGHRSDRPSTA